MSSGWTTRTLGDVCEVRGGGTPATSVERYWTGDIPWVSPKDMKSEIVIDSIDHISSEAVTARATNLVPQGSILIVVRSGILARTIPLAIAGRTLAINQDIKAFNPCKELLPRFLYLFLLSQEFVVMGMVSKGATVHRIDVERLKRVVVPVPPLSEQERIIAVLDQAFERIDLAIQRAKRQLEAIRIGFDACLRANFASSFETGRLTKLRELAVDIVDGDHMPPPKSKSGVPFVTISNIDKFSHRIDFSNTFFVAREYFDKLKPNRKPQLGDVLYTVTGSFGIPVKIEIEEDFCFQRHIGLIRPKTEVDPSWLYYLIRSPQLVEQAEERATGTAQRTVPLSVLRDFDVPHAPLAEQRSAAHRLAKVQEKMDQLETCVTHKLKAFNKLKQSLLHAAFSGNL